MWKPYLVRFWNHTQSSGAQFDKATKTYIKPILNDCFGNSVTWKGKARTEQEAIKKAQKNQSYFRLHSVKVIS